LACIGCTLVNALLIQVELQISSKVWLVCDSLTWSSFFWFHPLSNFLMKHCVLEAGYAAIYK
jgi:hypothetical protein